MSRQTDVITVVSGLPRSGTSMMMQMLRAGGMSLMADDQRGADPNNPKGYLEYEPVKTLQKDASWVPYCRGLAVKIVAPLVSHLPLEEQYKVIFMEREMGEVLASQRSMLKRSGMQTNPAHDERLGQHFAKSLEKVRAWLQQQENVEAIYVAHHLCVNKPATVAAKVAAFLDPLREKPLNQQAMARVVDPSLYRERL